MTSTYVHPLRSAVVEQLGENNPEDLACMLRDVANHGADAGFPGFTYYNDTCEFFLANRAAILALVKEQARECGQSAMDFVKSFRCIADVDEDEIGRALYGTVADDDTDVPNALAWFALEDVGRAEQA